MKTHDGRDRQAHDARAISGVRFPAFYDLCRIPHSDNVPRQILEYTAARADNRTVSDRHAGPTDMLLPEKAGTYDAVFSSEVIEHLFDVDSYLKAIHDLLKPGGTFVLTTPYHGLVKNIVIDLTNYSKHYDPLGQHIRFFDRKSLDMCLRKWGLISRSWTGYGRPWPLWKSFFVVCEKAGA